MKLFGRIIILLLFLILAVSGTASATPSTTYWTPATTDVQPFNVWHIGVDNYFRLSRSQEEIANGQLGNFSTVLGLTVGVLPFEKLNLEVGLDLLVPGTNTHPAVRSIGNSVLGNAKFGIPEGALASWSPALNVGMFNIGTRSNITDMNIVDILVGKTLGPFGRIHAGYYYGNPGSALMHESGCLRNHPTLGCVNADGAGSLENDGLLVGYDFGFWKIKDKEGNEYNKWVLAADYASGKNFIGGGGFGIYHYFTKDISLLTGPIWFNDHVINGQWKWTMQLDINY